MSYKTIRTRGDGMEKSPSISLSESNTNTLNIKQKTNLSTFLRSLKPIQPSAKVHYATPKYIPKEQKSLKMSLKKPREPKFVPYEPYKAAVEPIIIPKPVPKSLKAAKNNVEIQELVTQMSEFRMAEMDKAKLVALENNEPLIAKEQWQKERDAYENDIKNLRETNAHLENQLKFQAQVNSELKTLLVAAVGEDLETRVQHLTEDKLQLARALLNSANHLTSHQEQTEWLSGQCEVWRSKFLASSLMVEELARWKSALTTRIADLQDTLRALLDDSSKIYKNNLTVNHNLTTLSKQSSPEPTNNNLQLSKANVSLTEILAGLQNLKMASSLQQPHQKYTPNEQKAIRLLKNPVVLSNKQEAVCNAVLGAATSLCGQQLFLQHPSIHATCCAHCKGDVQNI